MTLNGVAIGENGGTLVGIEETTYGTASASMIEQHPKPTTLTLVKELREPRQFAPGPPPIRDYMIQTGDGDITIGVSRSRAVIAPVLATMGALTTDDYKIGGGTVRDEASNTVVVDNDGHTMQFLGAVPVSAQWAIAADSEVILTVTYLCQDGSKITTPAISNPAESGLYMDRDMGTITVGGATFCILSANITANLPVAGSDRKCVGGSLIKQPRDLRQPPIDLVLNCELSSTTGEDSEDLLDSWEAGTAIGDVVIGDFEITGCYTTGPGPAKTEGIIQLALACQGEYLTVTTTA